LQRRIPDGQLPIYALTVFLLVLAALLFTQQFACWTLCYPVSSSVGFPFVFGYVEGHPGAYVAIFDPVAFLLDFALFYAISAALVAFHRAFPVREWKPRDIER
jgi:hypothetical protein